MKVKNIIKAGFMLSVAAVCSQAQAMTFGFGCITNKSMTNCATGEAQLSVDVTDGGVNGVSGMNQVLFTFFNTWF